MVPLASFAWLRGRCRASRQRIAWFHPAVELAAIGVPASAACAGAEPRLLWIGCFLGWTLLALAWIDWERFRLPDALTLPLLLAGLTATWWLAPDALAAHALGAAVGYSALRLLDAVYRRLRGREGIGHGDAKLLAASGAWLGIAALPPTLLLAAICRIGVALGFQASGVSVRRTTPVPFGTCRGRRHMSGLAARCRRLEGIGTRESASNV